ncbi:MAG: M14 family zinc carboxypeptidase [Solirubrobacterales bacterium]
MRFHAVVVIAVAGLLAAAAPAAAQAPCDPTQTPPEFRGEVPELADVVTNPGGEGGEVTTDQAYEYMDAVDSASDRVITGALDQRSWQGRELRWAIVGNEDRLGDRALDKIKKAAQKLRDPDTSAGQARKIADRFPAILWVASNVHGGEESGTEGSLRVLYELADRDDCAARQILDNSIVVLLPIQNPDGRELNTRQNSYGFDMNRDWFARTQRETEGKLEMLREFPGPLYIDAHEMGGTSYFFPPNSDPIYHEITDESIDWINNVYGASMADEFNRQGIDFFNRDVYDLFYMGYGDTVPSTGFISAGMTFEKGGSSPISERGYEQYLTQWVSLSQASIRKDTILREWAAAWREAYDQGHEGVLEPNEVINPGNEVETEVPDRRVRHYFITERRDSKQDEVQAMVRRLQRMDVDVYKLRKGLHVPDFTPYGRRTRDRWMPPGTFYVPMAQMQKHWVQAMLNEDTYTQFPYFYDVTAWSQPLLFNVNGGYSGERLRAKTSRLGELDDPGGPALPSDPPRVALFQLSESSTSALESSGWLRYVLEQVWDLPYTDVTAADIAGGALADYDAVVVPNGPAATGFADLGATGQQALRDWVNGGGHLIGWRGGTELAAQLGISTAVLADPTSDVPGSMLRVRVDEDSSLRRGVGRQAYAFYEYDSVMQGSSPEHEVVKFPPADSGDWFVSGFADGAEELGGTAAVVDEPVGAGRATVFSVEPNFRAFTDGFREVLRNALLRGDAGVARASESASAARDRARRAAGQLTGSTATIRLSVRPASAESAESVLSRYGARYQVQRSRGRVSFLIANPRELTADEHPFAARLPGALESAGVRTIAYRTP